MNISSVLIDAVLGGLAGGGRKQARRARRFLTGRRGGLLSNPSTVLTAAGLAWGVYETLQRTGVRSSGAVPPPVMSPPPPERAAVSHAAAPEPPAPAIDPSAMRLIRVAISAAAADGAFTDQERAAIAEHARSAGLADLVDRELRSPRPVHELAGGVTAPEEAATLYVAAFTILRADEQLTATERIYLAQLAHLLGIDRSTAEALEQDTGERIDALGDQGQPGG
jgi:uncharacterized membrane protein YebE (DUF533 family)